jgi:lysophospholipid acyltransferase (LPLAT)-like uncharacterized protein
MPFSRNAVVYGEPFPIERSDSDAKAVARIAAALEGATQEADTACGTRPPAPA